MIEDKRSKFGGKNFQYPENHKLGTKVPRGGSMCDNCKFLGNDHKTCTNKEWVKWNGNDNRLPFDDEEYCCDLWELGNNEKTEEKEPQVK